MRVRMRFSVVCKEVFIEPMIIKFKKKGFTKKPVILKYFTIQNRFCTRKVIVNPINSQEFLQKRCDEHKNSKVNNLVFN